MRTEFELPQSRVDGRIEDKHNDDRIQTLLFPEDMAAALERLRRAARSGIEDKGVNLLHLAFGFLEWRDREEDRLNTAPLILMPVSLDRGPVDPESGMRRFLLTQSGEDIGINLSLREKLNHEFQLSLPDIALPDNPDELIEPELYYESFKGILRTKPYWKLRRSLTLGLFEFGKLLLYRDLDPRSWPSGSAITSHRLVRPFFETVAQSNLERSNEHADLDSQSNGVRAPLIFEADSSQHSAMIDALDGQNLVIQGPPGTGKSQTITNLIAASIAAGKSVLFVSEKMAALEVVRRRMDEAGMGCFCLELHSHRTQKQALLADLKRRLNLRHKFQAPRELERERKRLEDRRIRLLEYSKLISDSWGAINWTRQRIIATKVDQELRIENLADRIRAADIENPSRIDDVFIENSIRSVQRFTEIHSRLAAGTLWDKHPFRVFTNDRLGYADFGEFQAKKSAAIEACNKVAEAVGALDAACSTSFGRRLEALRELADSRARWPRTSQKLPPYFPALREKPNREKLSGFAEILRSAHDARSRVRSLIEIGAPDPSSVVRERLESAIAEIDSAHLAPLNLQGLHALEGQCRRASDRLLAANERIARLSSRHGIEVRPNADGLHLACAIIQISSEAPWDVLHYRSSIPDIRQAAAISDECISTVAALKSRHEELSWQFAMSNLPPQTEIYRALAALKAVGKLAFLSADWRAARRFFRKISTSSLEPRGKERVEWLEGLGEFVKRREAFENDVGIRRAFGNFFAGWNTKFDVVIALSEWQGKLTNRLLPHEAGEALIDVIRSASEARLRTFAGLVGSDLIAFRDADAALEDLIEILPIRARVQAKNEFGSIATECVRLGDRLAKVISDWEAARLRPELTLHQLRPALLSMSQQQAADIAVSTAAASCELLRSVDLSCKPEDIEGYVDFAERIEVADIDKNFKHSLFNAPQASGIAIEQKVTALDQAIVGFDAARRELAPLVRPNDGKWPVHDPAHLTLGDFELSLSELPKDARTLDDIGSHCEELGKLKAVGFESLVGAVLDGSVPTSAASDLCQLQIYRAMADSVIGESKLMQRFRRQDLTDAGDEFREIDATLIDLQRVELARLTDTRSVPAGARGGKVAEFTEESLINHEIGKQKRNIPIRQLVRRAGRALQALKPCFMMSPMSVAQYLAPGEIEFDLLVMDEASQIKPEEALGAIARAKQVVIVGDSNQLPPTDFFQSYSGDDGLDGTDLDDFSVAQESKSILEAAVNIWQQRWLRWHYRSRHESLIRFSNRHFYDDQLVVFPSAWGKSPDYGIEWQFVSNGRFDAGRNVEEAKIVVEIAIRHMKTRSESLGIAAMNLGQAELIEDLLDEAVKTSPDAEQWIKAKSSGPEPLFIKNLENVQGDERDVIIASFTYGNGAAAPPGQNFGPINREAGWRRLNVLFTRAKKRMVVCASMRHDGIRINEGGRRGLAALRNFLHYAESGQLSISEATGRSPDSPFETAVIRALEAEGLICVPQLGVDRYRIDVAVQHANRRDVYILGIECDGAPFHSGSSVRDRDRIRQMVLESLGWNIHRIWSPDWYRDPKAEIGRVLARIDELHKLDATAFKLDAAKSDSGLANMETGDKSAVEKQKENTLQLETPVAKTSSQPSLPMAFSSPKRKRSGISREEARAELIALRENVIKQHFPQDDPARGILRKSMLESFVAKCPKDRGSFLTFVPLRLREQTNTEQVRLYLDKILEILAEVDDD